MQGHLKAAHLGAERGAVVIRLQSQQNGCGPSTVANILRSLGLDTTEDQVSKRAKLAGSVNDPHPGLGTVEAQIMRCLEAMKVSHFQMMAHTPELAVAALRGQLVLGRPAMLAVDNDDHWIGVIGVQGDRFVTVDSADSELVVCPSGVEIAKRWGGATDPPRFYAIVVTGLKTRKRK